MAGSCATLGSTRVAFIHRAGCCERWSPQDRDRAETWILRICASPARRPGTKRSPGTGNFNRLRRKLVMEPMEWGQTLAIDQPFSDRAWAWQTKALPLDDDRYPLSPRVQTWKAILGKIHPQTPREPLPPATKVDEPPSKGRYRRR